MMSQVDPLPIVHKLKDAMAAAGIPVPPPPTSTLEGYVAFLSFQILCHKTTLLADDPRAVDQDNLGVALALHLMIRARTHPMVDEFIVLAGYHFRPEILIDVLVDLAGGEDALAGVANACMVVGTP